MTEEAMVGVGVLAGAVDMRSQQTQRTHIDDELQLWQHIQFCQQVFNSNADWEYKYDRIFGIHRGFIRPLLSRMRIRLKWCDPDTTHEDDVTAYMKAVEEQLLPNVEAVVSGEF